MSTETTLSSALVLSGLVPLEAQVLLAHMLLQDRAWVIAHGDDSLTREQADAFFALARRRHEGEPVAYLTGMREFWDWRSGIARRHDPLPETETLVELALVRLPAARESRVLDLGTGSGAIALAIAHERPQASVLAVDASDPALAVAAGNARRLGIANVAFSRSDWYDGIPAEWLAAAFDLIASNPPYVRAGDPHLGRDDVRFEPPLALTPGGDGLDALRRIVAGAPSRLAPGGTLAVEHGYDQADEVRDLFRAAGFAHIVSARDLAGIPRVVAGTLDSPSTG